MARASAARCGHHLATTFATGIAWFTSGVPSTPTRMSAGLRIW